MIARLKHNCRNSEVNATTGRISGAYHQSSLTENTALAAIFDEIDPKNQQLTEAIKRMKAESKLEVTDEVRDTDHHALYHLVEGATYSTLPEVKAAAVKVFQILQNYGLSVTDESYDTETSYLDSLLKDLGAESLQTDIAAIPSCAERIAILQDSQNAFNAARLEFQLEQSREGKQENATMLKKQLLALVNEKMLVSLEGKLMDDPATFSDFADAVNQIITDTNEIVKKRIGK